MLENVKRAVSQPLVQFLVLGTVLFGLWMWLAGPAGEDDDKTIVITAADVSRLDAAWRARWNRPPTDEELLGIVRDYARETALYRHAVAMGLDKNDPTIRRMLSRKLETLTNSLIELSLSPTDEELATFFEINAENYRPPDLITLTQVFVDPDLRGDDTLPDAERILGELRAMGKPTPQSARLGDQFMLQSYYPAKTEGEIAKFFGKGFAESVFALEPGGWYGPVLSGYGVHLVYVHHLETSPLPELASVREQVQQDWVDARRIELQEEFISEILANYEVVFEDAPDDAPSSIDQGSSESIG